MKYIKLFESVENEKLWDHSEWYFNREKGLISANNSEYKIESFTKKDITYITRALGQFKANPKKNIQIYSYSDINYGGSYNSEIKSAVMQISGVRHSLSIYKTDNHYYYVERTFPADFYGSYNSYYKYKCDTIEGVVQLFKEEIFKKWKPRIPTNDLKTSVINIINTLGDEELNRIKSILDNGEF